MTSTELNKKKQGNVFLCTVITECVADQLDMGIDMGAGFRFGQAPWDCIIIVCVPQSLQQ